MAYEIFEDNKLSSANQRAARYEAQLMSSRVELERISKRNIELESRYTEFLSIADILPSSVVVISMEGKIIYANSAAILMMGNDLLECENIDNRLKRHLIVKNDENYDEIIARDMNDLNRKIAPLRPAVNSVLLDTSYLDIEQAFNAIIKNI